VTLDSGVDGSGEVISSPATTDSGVEVGVASAGACSTGVTPSPGTGVSVDSG
jgi:hypothetical protein